jgi:mono/diheme cytochrome c family protein
MQANGEFNMKQNHRPRSPRRFLPGAGLLLLVALAGLTSFAATRQKTTRRPVKGTAARAFTARPTPQRLARGRYLVETVSGCFDCHTVHEYVNGEWIPKPGNKGAGQVIPPDFIPLPPGARVVAPNITPDPKTGIGSWTDAEIERAIRHGVARSGRPLFNLMPYWQFRVLTDEDVKSIIVYLRSLPAVSNALPQTHLPFPVQVQMNDPRVPPLPANASALVRRGWYLTRISGCADCHTPILPGGRITRSLLFAGGMHFHGPFGDVFSLNITPSPSGIGFMNEAMFTRTLRTGRVNGTGLRLNPVMPFLAFHNLQSADIRAIFAYLRTVPPVRHEIDNTDPPTFCKLCRQKHGLGDRN